MVEKKLNFNAPLLSVRRLTTPTSISDELFTNSGKKPRPIRQQSLPATRSQFEPEQFTKPASIPFIWEQIPGQAKDRKTPNSIQPPNSHAVCSSTPSIDESETLSILSMSFSCETNSDNESSKSFNFNSQTREYLLNRFLPAAKLMIVETPQYVTKKHEAPIMELPKYVKKVYSGELRPMLLEKYPINKANNQANEDVEEEDKSVVVDECKKKLRKKGLGFGFFLPRICTKRSSWSLNPMPVTKSKVHQSQSPVSDSVPMIPRLSRRGSYSGPLTPSLEKQAMDVVIKKRAESQSKEANETRHKSGPLTRSGNSLPSSPHRSLSRSGQIYPYRNESPRSPFHDGARFLGVPKEVQNRVVQPKTCPSLNVKSHFSPRLMHDSPPLAPEKTLYIDWNEKITNLTTNEAKIEPNGDAYGSVPVPPLPKSPSESWLRRKMTLRSPFPRKTQPVPVDQSPKNGPKWETIVKTSNVRHDHARYSEELLNVSKYTEVSF